MMYIVFEGIVGAGKSTQVRKLVEYLESVIASEAWRSSYKKDSFIYPGLLGASQGQKPYILQIREPGSTPIAEEIRTLAQAKEWQDEAMHPLTNAYLYAAARAQTLHTVVKPTLTSGKIVISDRSFLSSLAYQGEAQGLGFDTVLSVSQEAIADILPDIVFYMDIDVDRGLCRTFDEVGDKWESEGKEFFHRVKQGYEKCEKLEILKNKIIRIDANGTEDEVFEKILQKLIIKSNNE